ncbi:hypothetical protein ccbrp13_00800 [Ktedonobacteria bacterium brp13]|nr:hypothetical protein ccbrp13_00800 [Ktedonobacteria bacterium brp13]
MAKKTGQSQRGLTLSSLLLALLGLAVVVVIIAFGLPLLLQNANGANNPNTGGTDPIGGQSTPAAPPANKGSGGGYSDAFLTTVKEHIAQGLHLTVDQVTAQVSGGKQSTDVATAQGISANQLHTIELNAYQAAFDQAVQQGVYTQSQAVSYMDSYRQRDPGRHNDNVTFLFGGAPPLEHPPGQGNK